LLSEGLSPDQQGHALTVRDAGIALLDIIEGGRMDLAIAPLDLAARCKTLPISWL
jgi:hypothetical protein